LSPLQISKRLNNELLSFPKATCSCAD
jgi:hypothetical protein